MSRHTVVTIKYAALRCLRYDVPKVYSYDVVRTPAKHGGEYRENVRRSGVVLPGAYRD